MSSVKTLLVVLFLFPLTGISFGQDAGKPNILIVIADDWSFGHAGVYGDRVVRTPNIDALGKEGAVFMNAFTAAPSCTPARAAILTGRFPHELEQGASLWGYLPKKFVNYTEILESSGYVVGLTGKGWGPGNYQAGGYEHNPAGKSSRNFEAFLSDRPDGMPFAFWFGSQNPHRPYLSGAGATSGMQASEVEVPAWLPDVTEVRDDILDYYSEVERFDHEVGEIMSVLKSSGEYNNTLIIITSDNGMPFPRAKANVYDSGAKVPLIIKMNGKIDATRVTDLVSLVDLAPTILEVTGHQADPGMSGSSLWPLLSKGMAAERKAVFIERERHANVRDAELGYPARAIRTEQYLYIRNYAPDRWPAGDPKVYHSVGPYGDIDGSPSKQYILENQTDPVIAPFFARGFAKRAAEELYDLKNDPQQLNNIASDKRYRKVVSGLKKRMHEWQMSTGDPRASGSGVMFDRYPYFGPPVDGAPSRYKPVLNK